MGQGNDLNILIDEYCDDEIPIFSIFGDMSPVAFLDARRLPLLPDAAAAAAAAAQI
jgi:hypothetical protein